MKYASLTETTKFSGRLTIMHAGSLTGMCKAVHDEFKRLNPEKEIVDVSGGGVMLVRELNKGKQADIYLSVDYADIPKLMIPDFADWFVIFAATGFVLRYTNQSKYAGEVTSKNWLEIIQREDVRFWRSDPENNPAGYRSLMVFQLAEKYYKIPGLAEKLAKRVGSSSFPPTSSRKGIKAIRFLTARGQWAEK